MLGLFEYWTVTHNFACFLIFKNTIVLTFMSKKLVAKVSFWLIVSAHNTISTSTRMCAVLFYVFC